MIEINSRIVETLCLSKRVTASVLASGGKGGQVVGPGRVNFAVSGGQFGI